MREFLLMNNQGGEPEDKTNPLFVTARSNLRANVSSSSPDVTENSANVYLDIRSNLKKGRSTGNVTEIAQDKVMPSETVQSHGSNSPSQNRRFSPNIKNTSNTTNSYLDIRSNLRKGRSTENLTEGAQDKVNSEETGQAYSTVRAKLHKTNMTVTTTNSSTEEIKSPPESSSENKSSSDSSSENKSFSESSVIELSQDNNKKMLTRPTENDCCTTAHYADMRAQLHKTNRNLTDIESNIFTKNSQSTKSIETSNELSGKRDKALSPEQTFVNTRMSLHPTGLLERELDKTEENKPELFTNQLQSSPFKIEKKNTVKLKSIDLLDNKTSTVNNAYVSTGNIEQKNDENTDQRDVENIVEKDTVVKVDIISGSNTDIIQLNPFITPDSSPIMKNKNNMNPFLSSTEDLLFENESDEFDNSNPFADDARLERRDTALRKSIEKKNGNSHSREKELLKIGIDDNNPFADDVLGEMSNDNLEEIHVPKVESHIRRTGNKKLVLKTNKGQRVHGPVLKSSNVKEDLVKPVAKPRYKKRSAPQVPMAIEANTPPSPVSRQISSGKKRPAPRRPATAPNTIADDNKIMNRDSEVQGDIKETLPPHVSTTHKASDKTPSLKNTEPPVLSEISTPTEPTLVAKPAPSMEEVESATYDDSTLYMNGIGSGTVEQKLSTTADSDKDASFITNVSSATDTDSYISELSSTADQESTPHHPPPLSRQSTEKRKAPARPAPPHMNLDENTILQNVALRDRQPKREEINKELQFLEIRQRELEMEGVVMEKKLRDNSDSKWVYYPIFVDHMIKSFTIIMASGSKYNYSFLRNMLFLYPLNLKRVLVVETL